MSRASRIAAVLFVAASVSAATKHDVTIACRPGVQAEITCTLENGLAEPVLVPATPFIAEGPGEGEYLYKFVFGDRFEHVFQYGRGKLDLPFQLEPVVHLTSDAIRGLRTLPAGGRATIHVQWTPPDGARWQARVKMIFVRRSRLEKAMARVKAECAAWADAALLGAAPLPPQAWPVRDPSALKRSYDYDGCRDVLSEAFEHVASESFTIGLARAAVNQLGPTWQSGAYTYDGAGNVSAIGTNLYTYDAMSRLGPYHYDAYGNMTQYAVDANNHRYGDGIHYDEAGNLKEFGGEHYSYDAAGVMVAKEHGMPTWYDRYLYTADDQRIGARVGDTWTWTFRDASQNVARQYRSSYSNPAGNWRWTEDYVYGPRGLAAAEQTDGRRHFHLDHLGTPRLITSNTGASVAQHDYSPFGVEDPPQSEEVRKFTGHERDLVPAGQPNPTRYLDYMHARYYDPHEARFLAVDPNLDYEKVMHDPQQWNRYAYVANNPMNRNDPTGAIFVVLSGRRTIMEIAGDAASRTKINEDGTLDVSQYTVDDLTTNEGALLLWQMAHSTNKYTYEEDSVMKTKGGPHPVDGITNLDAQPNGEKGTPKKNFGLPVQGVDGAVAIDPAVPYVDKQTGMITVPLAALAFHELAESFSKVENSIPRGPATGPGAHYDAAIREQSLMNQRPGWTQYPASGDVRKK
jgi:RHS repeat-associated protein